MAIEAADALPGKRKSNVEIAHQAGVSVGMVRTHRNNLSSLTCYDDKSTVINGLDGIDRHPPFVPPVIPRDPDPDDKPFSLERLRDDIAPEARHRTQAVFNQTNEMVDWAKWTWNPVTGCEHTCRYCYARDIAERIYPEKFKPTFHPDRLPAPRNTTPPRCATRARDPVERIAWRNVFVGSMADMFGRWVPDEWIDQVFQSCRRSRQWNYLFLTKFPQRYDNLVFPENSWVGTTVDEQKRVAGAEKAFRKIKDVPVKWLSVEPMKEAVEFSDLRMFDWVVIGGQTANSEEPECFPEPAWVNRLIDRALAAGCAVFCKPNTDPGRHWSALFKGYPAAFFADGRP
jgi:protein gp37